MTIAEVDWRSGREAVLKQLLECFKPIFAGSDFSICRNTTVNEMNLNIFRKGENKRVAQIWPSVQTKTIGVGLTLELFNSLKLLIELPPDTDIKQPGRYPGWRDLKRVQPEKVVEILEAMATIQ